MSRSRNTLLQFWHDERGRIAVEYCTAAGMLAGIVATLIGHEQSVEASTMSRGWIAALNAPR